jgi:hypothetical protein
MIQHQSEADPVKLVFFATEEFLRFFAAKLGHFIINDFFLNASNTQASQQRLEKEEKN